MNSYRRRMSGYRLARPVLSAWKGRNQRWPDAYSHTARLNFWRGAQEFILAATASPSAALATIAQRTAAR